MTLNGYQSGVFTALVTVGMSSIFSNNSADVDAYATIPLCILSLIAIFFDVGNREDSGVGQAKFDLVVGQRDELNERFTILYSAHQLLVEEALKMRSRLDELESNVER